MSDQDGGPAFPVHHSDTQYLPTGMSLRDWFAGQALTGLAANSHYIAYVRGHIKGAGTDEKSANDRGIDSMAAEAYRIADALIDERGK